MALCTSLASPRLACKQGTLYIKVSLGSRHAICYLCFCCRVYLEISIAVGPSLFPFAGRDSPDSANHEDLGRRTGSIDAPVADLRGKVLEYYCGDWITYACRWNVYYYCIYYQWHVLILWLFSVSLPLYGCFTLYSVHSPLISCTVLRSGVTLASRLR